jgi:hypothetical protein
MSERLREWWPDFDLLVSELRRVGADDAAGQLMDALRGGATSTEILGGVGLVLHAHRGLRKSLSAAGARAWEAVSANVDKAFPGRRVWYFLRHFFKPKKFSPRS